MVCSQEVPTMIYNKKLNRVDQSVLSFDYLDSHWCYNYDKSNIGEA